jgi:dTDP-4-amino-4,6-dideoxygalactose transaminase
LHGTKLLNTAEGGGCVTQNTELREKLKRIRFFGHDEQKDIVEDGFNGKMTEVHAGLGIANLKYFDKVLSDRKIKYRYYKEKLSDVKSLAFQSQKFGESNCSYFPLIFESDTQLLQVEKALNGANIFPRRYFYPSLNTYRKVVDYVPMPASENVSSRIMCLPLYFNLGAHDMDKAIDVIKSHL